MQYLKRIVMVALLLVVIIKLASFVADVGYAWVTGQEIFPGLWEVFHREEAEATEPVIIETEPPETLPPETEPVETEPVTEPTVPPETEPLDPNAPRGHNGVPLYFQTDYPDQMYGMGTMASNGCSATSLAMVATYLTGHTYTPDELGRYFGGAAENNIKRLELGSETLRLPYKKSYNWHETYAALKQGKIVIALMRSESIFTDSQHFIILTGFNEEGKIMVNDSYEPNYYRWETERGLR